MKKAMENSMAFSLNKKRGHLLTVKVLSFACIEKDMLRYICQKEQSDRW